MRAIIKYCFIFLFAIVQGIAYGQYPPPAGQPGSTAIYKDSSVFVAWADSCIIIRGYLDISDKPAGHTDTGDSLSAVGYAGVDGAVSLGDSGIAILTFNGLIYNGTGPDFAVFENSFNDDFLELAFIEVSSDGVNYFRFPSVSLTDTTTQTGTYGLTEAEKINNLAGKYKANYGTPFDLEDLTNISGLDVNHISHIKVVDVIGSIDSLYCSYDSQGNKINDPWPTAFSSGGFDLDAVGVIHLTTSQINEVNSDIYISVFPNPANAYLNISFNETGRTNLTITDSGGDLIYQKQYSGSVNEKIDLSTFSSGILILKFKSNDHVITKKLIKVKD